MRSKEAPGMKHKFVRQDGSRRLLLIFAGWGMDSCPFAHVGRPGYDTMVVWDYRTLSIDWTAVSGYDEIVMIAWSMGVYAASMTIHPIRHLITAAIAVNGTMTPVDNMCGIPEAIYEGTAAGLDERSLRKFFRRMCGDRATTEHFMAAAPRRSAAELTEELHAIWPEPWFANPKAGDWDLAVIGRQDAIFPACNQQRAWAGTPVAVVDRPHYIDLQEIADAYVIDKERAADCFDAGRETYDANTPVQQAIVEALTDDMVRNRIDRQLSQPGTVCLEIGSGTGSLTRRLAAMMPHGFIYAWDIGGCAPESVDPSRFMSCDAELRICRTQGGRYDAIATASTVQWFNSPGRFIRECLRVLRPGGVLLMTAFVRGNMHELTAACGVGLSLPDERRWASMIPGGFETVSWETADYDMSFESATDVLRHLRLSGVNGLGRSSRQVSGLSVVRHYPRMLDGRYHLSYRTIRMILRKKGNV